MSVYALRAYTAQEVRLASDSPAFELTLCLDGVPVAHVYNQGRGGADVWAPPLGGSRGDFEKARAVFRLLAATALGERDEVEGSIIAALADGAANGEEGVAMVHAFHEEMERREARAVARVSCGPRAGVRPCR